MLMSRYPVGRHGRTAYDQHAGTACRRQLVEFGSVCSSCHFVLEVHDKQKLDPECHEGTFIGIRDRSDVECRKNEERARGGKSWNHGISSLTDTPWKPAPVAGDMAADALPADMAVPMPAPAPVPPRRGGGSARGQSSKQVVNQESSRAEVGLHQELSWIEISDGCHGCTCAH